MPSSRTLGDSTVVKNLADLVAHDLSRSGLEWGPTAWHPCGGARWCPSTALLEASWWRTAAAAYSRHLMTPHRVPGAVCALQHYTGRLFSVATAIWYSTGRAPDMSHHLWRAVIDDRGATTAVDSPQLALTRQPCGPEDLCRHLLEHCSAMVAAVTSVSGVRVPIVLGSVAASLAGSFHSVMRTRPSIEHPDIISAAVAALDVLDGQAGQRLVDVEVGNDANPLVQHRRLCCLIHLGKDHGRCSTCPGMHRPERIRRQLSCSRPRLTGLPSRRQEPNR